MSSGTYPPELIGNYARLRRKLVLFFDRRHSPGEELADETLFRVVQRFANGSPIADLERFAYGTARHVHADWVKAQHRPTPSSVFPVMPASEDARCLAECVRRLDADQRELLEAYFLEKTERPLLATRLGLTLNALRLKVWRLKNELRACLDACRQLARG